jgi:glucose uptake protein GlcU
VLTGWKDTLLTVEGSRNRIGTLGAIWGIGGVTILIASAVYRMTPIILTAFGYRLSWYHWIVAVAFLAFMLHSEGYRGFHRGFAPRVAARALHLSRNPRWSHALFAPFFCMGYFHATRRRQITSISVTSAIIVAVILVHFFHQPWRGIIDLGVVAGLVWGLGSILFFGFRALLGSGSSFPADVPS